VLCTEEIPSSFLGQGRKSQGESPDGDAEKTQPEARMISCE